MTRLPANIIRNLFVPSFCVMISHTDREYVSFLQPRLSSQLWILVYLSLYVLPILAPTGLTCCKLYLTMFLFCYVWSGFCILGCSQYYHSWNYSPNVGLLLRLLHWNSSSVNTGCYPFRWRTCISVSHINVWWLWIFVCLTVFISYLCNM